MRSNRLKLNSDKTQFTWLGSKQQLAKIESRVHAHWRTLHQILNLRKESGSDIRPRTEDGLACQQYNELLLSVEAAADQSDDRSQWRCHEYIGPFPWIKSRGLLQQHFLRSHKRYSTTSCNPFSMRRPG